MRTLHLVYRTRILAKTGTVCLAFFALSPAKTAAQEESVRGPFSAPTPAKVPQIPPDRDPAIKRRQEHKREQEEKNLKEKEIVEDRHNEASKENMKKEASVPRPLYSFLELSILYPKAVASGSRVNYRAEFTTHIVAMARAMPSRDVDRIQPWIGIRYAPFAGTGSQNGHLGRFALTYFGPAIGFGSISQLSLPNDDTGSPQNENESLPTRSGWLASAGIAAVSRLSLSDEPEKVHATDFQRTGLSFDSPGLWAEFRYIHIFLGALGVDGILGVQTGQNKAFAYGGVAVSGFM